MKYMKLSALLCMALYLLSMALSIRAEGSTAGDVNRDGTVNTTDAILLRCYLVGDPVAIYESEADFNKDHVVDLRDLVLLERFLGINAGEVSIHPSPTPLPQETVVSVRDIIYGKSERGRDLVCTVIEPEEYNRTVLINFAIHGFEDWYDHDAQVLVDTAELVISHFQEVEDLHGCRLMVVSCANPDGLLDGTTKDGFGRCNANGVDLNRDFDAAHYAYTTTRNYTPYAFSATESRALRDLVLTNRPDVVLDCHGWENCTIGDSELAKVFYEEEGLVHKVTFSDNAHGYFSYWAHRQGALALLVEFANPNFDKLAFVRALDRLVAEDYETNEGIYTQDSRFAGFSPIQAYTISTANVPVYLDINGEQVGTIYGSEDLCTIEKIYQNGWIRVRYPISAGYKEAYCLKDVFMNSIEAEMLEIHFEQNQTVYRRMDLIEKLGSVYQADTAYLVSRSENVWQILYPLDSGGWKLGWVRADQGSVSAASSVEESTGEVMEEPGTDTLHMNPSGDPALKLPDWKKRFDDVYAANTITASLSAGAVLFEPTGYIDVPILLQADDLTALRLWILMDDKTLELVSLENGNCLLGMTEAKDKAGGMSCVLWADSLQKEVTASNGTLAVARFSIKENAVVEQTAVTFLVPEGDAFTFEMDEASIRAFTVLVDAGNVKSGELSLSGDLEQIGEEAFMGGSFRKVILPAGTQSIGERAFADCSSLEEIYIPASTIFIAADAFSGISENITIYGEEGSYAEFYAQRYGIEFVSH